MILDEWYKVIFFIGCFGFFPSLVFDLPGIDEKFGMLFFGGFVEIGIGLAAYNKFRTEIISPAKSGNTTNRKSADRLKLTGVEGAIFHLIGAALIAGSIYHLYVNHI